MKYKIVVGSAATGEFVHNGMLPDHFHSMQDVFDAALGLLAPMALTRQKEVRLFVERLPTPLRAWFHLHGRDLGQKASCPRIHLYEWWDGWISTQTLT
jgi:hypothetical protein